MFKNITDLSSRKTIKEAIGFYISFSIFGILFAMLLGGLASLYFNTSSFDEGFEVGIKIGVFFAVVYSFIFSFIILFKRNLQNNFYYIFLSILAGILAFLGGVFLGLIVPSFLLTRAK